MGNILRAVFDPSWLAGVSTALQLHAQCRSIFWKPQSFWIKSRFVNLWQWGRMQSRKDFAAFSKVNYVRHNRTTKLIRTSFLWFSIFNLFLRHIDTASCWMCINQNVPDLGCLPQNVNLFTGSAACDFGQMCSAAAALQRLSCELEVDNFIETHISITNHVWYWVIDVARCQARRYP